MVLVEVFSGEGCHLCESAVTTLVRLQKLHPFELRETIIEEGDPLFEGMKDRIPVIHIGGRYAFHYRVREAEFISKLNAAAAERP